VRNLSTRSDVQTPSGGDPIPQITPPLSRLGQYFGTTAAASIFVLLGAALIPYPGIYDDEVIFAGPLYLPSAKAFGIGLFHRHIDLMLLSYLGTLKTLVYIPILAAFGNNAWSLRLPMVLLGALTILFLYGLTRSTVSPTAAIMAAFLLATDTSFIFTNTMDWGPVAIEHFLLVTGCFFLAKFAQQSRRAYLFLGFFLFGLALWNKAIFIWALAGLTCATLTIFWREIRKLFCPATASIAGAAFLLGALPLVVYNVRNPNSTVGRNVHFETDKLSGKLNMLRGTLDGSGLFGFLFGLDDSESPKAPASLHGRAATWIAQHTPRFMGNPRRNLLLVGYLLALLLIPWWWRYRAARFSLIFMCIAWLAMAVTREAGGSVHHTVLLWPFPQLFLATALAALPWRRIAVIAASLLITVNLLVVNQAVADAERNGSPGNFSDASFGLSREFEANRSPIVFTLDWGILDMLAFTERGRLPLRIGEGALKTASPNEDERKEIDWVFSNQDAIFVTHVVGRENWPEVRTNLDREAAAHGVRKEIVKIVPDSNGRPVFEVFKFIQ
jgi:Dolichyl-phosphate-mannose-protein mannosyltransferase